MLLSTHSDYVSLMIAVAIFVAFFGIGNLIFTFFENRKNKKGK